MTNEDEFFDDDDAPAPAQHQPTTAPAPVEDDEGEIFDEAVTDPKGERGEALDTGEIDPDKVPEQWDGYEIRSELAETITPQDAPILESWLQQAAISSGMSNEQVNQSVQWYRGLHEQEQQRQQAADLQHRDRALRDLTKDLGKSAMSEIQSAGVFMREQLGEKGFRNLVNARTPTGKLANDPSFLKMIIRLRDAAVRSDEGPSNSASRRLAEIDRTMRSDYGRYISEGMSEEAVAIREQAQRPAGRPAGPSQREQYLRSKMGAREYFSPGSGRDGLSMSDELTKLIARRTGGR